MAHVCVTPNERRRTNPFPTKDQTMALNETQKTKAAALRTEMQKLDPETYQEIRRSYYKVAEELRPLADALEKADADLGPNGPLLEEHYLFCEMLDRLNKSLLGAVV